MRRRAWRFFLPLFFLSLGMAAPGCSGSGDELPREPISGTVTLDSQPLADGAIQFTPVQGAPTAGGSPIKDGQFSIDREHGLVPGNYKVAVNAASKHTESQKPAEPGRPNRADRPKETIPMKYNAQTTLTAEVKKGVSNYFKYDLQSK
jgi:hypothetical protein